ncbi:MAG: DsbA family protein [Proteobacteria bacterium]|nr:DsbA family protein [Pseudomonadota bacterium]
MRLGLIMLACAGALAATIPAVRAQTAADPTAAAERARIKEIVREVLKENPDLVLDAIQSLETREREEAATKAARALTEYRGRLERDAGDPVGGNPKGDVTLVVFSDYKCPYCKQVSDQLFQAVQGDGKVRLVFKELPILGRESRIAAHAALAAVGQGKYIAFHRALFAERGPLDEANVLRIAGTVGLDTTKLKTDMAKGEIDALIKRNLELAHALDIRGTPAFVIGNELIPGAVDAASLRAAIDKARGG